MSGEKTEQATPQKLKDARKKGQISQSQDLTKLLIGLGITEAVFALLDGTMARLSELIAAPLMQLGNDFPGAINSVFASAAQVLLPVLACTLLAAVILRIMGGWLQFGVLFAPEAAKPKLDALNPASKIKNIFSLRQLVTLLLSVVKAIALALLFWTLLKTRLNDIAHLAFASPDGFWRASAAVLHSLSRALFGVMLAFSLLDFGIQRYFWLKQNRMSHDDIRNEYKQNEGDPHTKGQRRQLARQLANEPIKKRSIEEVKQANVVLVNPTHFAIGLFYEAQETPLPRVQFKAKEQEALDIIDLAKQADVPVVRYIWLTRTLWRDAEEGDFIPRQTLKAVAQIYRLLRELEENLAEKTGEEIIEFRE